MIHCFLNRRALRRHLDDGEPLSTQAQAHLDQCPACRELLASHRRVISNLRPPSEIEAPFLHAQIMRAVARQSQISNSKFQIPWVRIGLASLIVMAAIFFAASNLRPKQTQLVKLDFPTFDSTPALSLEAPIQKELENLKADTKNAARALAANFLPSEP